MSTENQDGTTSFVITQSDMPEASQVTQEEDGSKLSANNDEGHTEVADEDKSKEQSESGDDAAAEQGKAQKPNRVQKRIDQVVKEREAEKRKNEALERELAELKRSKEEPQKPASKEPVESDFETYDEYLDALDSFEKSQDEAPKADKKTDKAPEQDKPAGLTESQMTAMAVLKETFDSQDLPEDFKAVALNAELPVTGEMLEALAECEDPAKVLYHLGKNKDLAAEIASKPALQQMREITKLDLTVVKAPPKPTKTTKAPDPIEPVGGADAQQKDISKMSFAEYEAHMNKAERERKSTW